MADLKWRQVFRKISPIHLKLGLEGFLGPLISNLTFTKKNKMADLKLRQFFRKIGPIHLEVFLRSLISNQTSI